MEGSELRALRLSANYKSGELAQALGVVPATITNYERGKSVIPPKIELAARYLCERRLATVMGAPEERLVAAIKELIAHGAAKQK